MNKNRLYILIAAILFLVFSSFWIYLGFENLRGDSDQAELFSATYGVLALYGGVIGLVISRQWGGRKSYIGRAVLLISCGLLAQAFGQVSYSMYTYLLDREIPYPSLGDVGYFGSVIFYIFAIYNILKATSVKLKYSSLKSKLAVTLIPILLLAMSYFQFLKGYEFDSNQPLTVFLDFAYPLGQAFYISLAILAYLLSRKYLGGLMRPVIVFVLFAFILQYISDFVFLYQNNRGTWETGGTNELMYLISYFAMTLALIRFSRVTTALKQPAVSNGNSDES